MKLFLSLFICVTMIQKCCSQGECPTAWDPAPRKVTQSKRPQTLGISDLGAGCLPLGLTLSTPIPRKQTRAKQEGENTRFPNLFLCKVKRVEVKPGPTLRMKTRAEGAADKMEEWELLFHSFQKFTMHRHWRWALRSLPKPNLGRFYEPYGSMADSFHKHNPVAYSFRLSYPPHLLLLLLETQLCVTEW